MFMRAAGGRPPTYASVLQVYGEYIYDTVLLRMLRATWQK
jgi:hypothetical protein